MPEPQSYANHVRSAQPIEYLVSVPLAANLLLASYRVLQEPTIDRVVNLGVAVALVALLFAVRRQITTVQDRVIRNEMRERMRQVLPADLSARAETIPIRQLVALRFAGNGELPELVREVVDGRLSSPKEIKMRVRDWQADSLRA
jgi:hypothetical protein